MKKENDELLCARYPKIFCDRHGDMTKTLMCWGFECGDGWFEILDTACSQIQVHLDKNLDVHQVVAVQIKEKFGTLRFYYDGGDDTVQDIVDAAEQATHTTCELCGQRGTTRGGGWIQTLCDECNLDGKLQKDFRKNSK